ncbi:hypothetical protein [Candidatus Phyllobacterium onerii]|uniref:hypothetical protein n=1 Tax=Candidatus Phyllobacterium onerii TaxID=3020828 RepID=UPI00232AF701|nr:hypothetical protein [Phyllobacterium sp. IY22]
MDRDCRMLVLELYYHAMKMLRANAGRGMDTKGTFDLAHVLANALHRVPDQSKRVRLTS